MNLLSNKEIAELITKNMDIEISPEHIDDAVMLESAVYDAAQEYSYLAVSVEIIEEDENLSVEKKRDLVNRLHLLKNMFSTGLYFIWWCFSEDEILYITLLGMRRAAIDSMMLSIDDIAEGINVECNYIPLRDYDVVEQVDVEAARNSIRAQLSLLSSEFRHRGEIYMTDNREKHLAEKYSVIEQYTNFADKEELSKLSWFNEVDPVLLNTDSLIDLGIDEKTSNELIKLESTIVERTKGDSYLLFDFVLDYQDHILATSGQDVDEMHESVIDYAMNYLGLTSVPLFLTLHRVNEKQYKVIGLSTLGTIKGASDLDKALTMNNKYPLIEDPVSKNIRILNVDMRNNVLITLGSLLSDDDKDVTFIISDTIKDCAPDKYTIRIINTEIHNENKTY